MLSGFDCYRKYLALKLHFKQESYDYFKFKGSTNLKTGTFEKRHDQYYFKKLVKVYDTEEKLETFLVSNILWRYSEFYIQDSFTEESKRIYVDYVKVRCALKYYFARDFETIKEHCERNSISNYLFVKQNTYPELLTLLNQNKIRIQSVFLLNEIRPFLTYWKEKISDQIFWPYTYIKILKLKSFYDTIDRSEFVKEYNKLITIKKQGSTLNYVTTR